MLIGDQTGTVRWIEKLFVLHFANTFIDYCFLCKNSRLIWTLTKFIFTCTSEEVKRKSVWYSSSYTSLLEYGRVLRRILVSGLQISACHLPPQFSCLILRHGWLSNTKRFVLINFLFFSVAFDTDTWFWLTICARLI